MTQKQFDEKLKISLDKNPEILHDALIKVASYQDNKLKNPLSGIDDQTKKWLGGVKGDLVINPDAKEIVTVITDYQCPYCKKVSSDIIQIANSTKKVRFVFKEFPMLGNISLKAAMLMVVANAKNSPKNTSLEVFDEFMRASPLSNNIINDGMKKLHVSEADFSNADNIKFFQFYKSQSEQMARNINFEGTPAIIYGSHVGNASSVDDLRNWIKSIL